jgi:hypothetical protein
MKWLIVGRSAYLVACGVVATGCFAGKAHAVGYDFRNVAGGQKIPQIEQAGRYICLDASPGAGGGVVFTIWSNIPQPVSSIVTIFIDTGRFQDLFTDFRVLAQTADGNIARGKPFTHAYFQKFSPDFAFFKPQGPLYHPGGINPGDFLVLAATLGPGRTFQDVITALNLGMNQASGVEGLRVAVIVHHLKGKRLDPNVTLMDDGGFMINAQTPNCQRR